MLNILTIDIEDYFQVHAFSKVIKYENWDNYECRIERNTDHILEILNGLPQASVLRPDSPVKATFFILGWIAERYPDLIRRIQKEGHEIACHGYAHQLIYHQTKDKFREDIKKAKTILEDMTGTEVIGYRAPSYSITDKSRWAFKVLAEEGFKYDSSIFPIRHDFYGMPTAPRFPFLISVNGTNNYEFSVLNLESLVPQSAICNPQSILEFPISTVHLFGQHLPISGGGYFRFFPYPVIKKGLKRINGKENKPFIFYIHPWEIDYEQPRIRGLRLKSRFRHYINLDKTENKFKRLLGDFQFSTFRHIVENSSTETQRDSI